MITLTRVFKFDAAHSLPDYPGKCANLHGHTWQVEIEIAGPGPKFPVQHPDGTFPTKYEGILIDFVDMKKIIEPLIDHLDHQHINEVIDIIPTAENLTERFVETLFEVFKLVRVRVYESDEAWAEWKKNDINHFHGMGVDSARK